MVKRKRNSHIHSPADEEGRAYASSEYWEERYQSGQNLVWYYDFECLEPLIETCISEIGSVLEIGCGDSPLVASLERRSLDLVGIDFSKTIIDGLTKQQKGRKDAKVRYLYMDARQMSFSNEQFGFVVDKGTIDAMLCDSEKGFENVRCILTESLRVMQKNSKLMVISNMEIESENFEEAMQQSIIPVLSNEVDTNWKLDAHTVVSSDGSSHATVYIFTRSLRPCTRALSNQLARKRAGCDPRRDFHLPINISEYDD
jgi:hypothetical protein